MLRLANIFRHRYPSSFAIAITCLLTWLCTYLSVEIMYDYSWIVFLLIPFTLGFLSTLLHGVIIQPEIKGLLRTAFLTLGFYCVGLLLFAIEGAVCLVMAAPIGAVLVLIGYVAARYFLEKNTDKVSRLSIWLTVICLPALTAFEGLKDEKEELAAVTTSVEISAPPEAVWQNVIAFPQLQPPTELIFKAGISYPINDTIEGKGVGAVRRCNFSTGSFVEPITTWDEAKLLSFSVLEQPETMKEFSLYELHPKHLHGYWFSKKGQFKLTLLPNGNTLLEGTTWYTSKIGPDFYWNLWSNYIVHTIHKRVLQHI